MVCALAIATKSFSMKRAVLYLRVSTIDQTTTNQERELRQIAAHMGCQIAKVYKDHGISGAKGRNGRPDFDSLCKAAARREFDLVMAWSVDRRHLDRRVAAGGGRTLWGQPQFGGALGPAL
jgi:DNA invertase Pin-like site-specific DNA recombinase